VTVYALNHIHSIQNPDRKSYRHWRERYGGNSNLFNEGKLCFKI